MPNPFITPGHWLKGNLHTHTTQSDGALSPAENVRWHEAQGYDFVSITDHNQLTNPEQFCDPQLLVLLGTELSLGATSGGGPFHLVTFGLPADFPVPRPNSLTPQAGIDLAGSSGAACFVAHPHWSVMTMEDLAGLTGYAGVEVYNTGCDWENRTGLAEPYWDDVLRRGQQVWGFATDDSHWREPDHGGGWIMVKAAERSASAVLDAIKAGQFYATSGPTIESLVVEGQVLRVRCSPAQAIYWTEGIRGWSFHAQDGELLTEAEFELKARQYFRVQVVDSAGRWAWSNPFFVT
jgi:hypothetical protein